jgi:hypothetical protein
MEIIPATDEPNDGGTAVVGDTPLGFNPGAPEPLGVESLEERVLLASDTPAAAAPDIVPPTEPAPYIAAPVAGGAPLHDLASAATPGSERDDNPVIVGQPRRDVVETPEEVKEVDGPEHAEVGEPLAEMGLGEGDSGRNEFGLATIEPEKGKAAHDHDKLRPAETFQPAGEELPETELAAGEVQGGEQPALDTRVLAELGRERPTTELGASLAEETAIAPLLDQGGLDQAGISATETRHLPTVDASPAEHQEDLVAPPQLDDSTSTSDPAATLTPVDEAHPADVARQSADAQPAASELLHGAPQSNANGAAGVSPGEVVAHDAVFAGGGGVEAVIEQAPRI